MTIKERYDFVVKNISRKPFNEFPVYEIENVPDFLKHPEKQIIKEGLNTFNIELNEKATEDDYYDYIEYVLERTGMDAVFTLDDKTAKGFDENEEDDFNV